jgi:4-amino-4-deoxy-L-arabinose transferase-like glycosyltransferase
VAPPGGAVWGLAAILFFAVAGRVAYLWSYRRSDPLYGYLLHDARVYHEWAAALAGGGGSEPGAFYQAPGYPFLLALIYRVFGVEPLAAYVVQTGMGLLVIGLVYRIASRAYDSRTGLVGAALAALYGSYPFYETKLLSTTPALLLTCLLVDRLQSAEARPRDRYWLGPGLVLGLACVSRPNFLLLLPLVSAWVLADRSRSWARRWRRVGLFVLAVIVVVSPLTLRNYRESGAFVAVATNGGISFFHGNNPQARGWFSAPGMSGSIRAQRAETRQLAERASGRELSDPEVSRYWFGRAVEFIRERPARFAWLQARKAFLALDDYEHGLDYSPELDANPLRRLFPVSFGLILALAAVRPFAGRRWTRIETPILLVMAAQVAALLLFFTAARYRLPATGPLLALAGCGALTLAPSVGDPAGGEPDCRRWSSRSSGCCRWPSCRPTGSEPTARCRRPGCATVRWPTTGRDGASKPCGCTRKRSRGIRPTPTPTSTGARRCSGWAAWRRRNAPFWPHSSATRIWSRHSSSWDRSTWRRGGSTPPRGPSPELSSSIRRTPPRRATCSEPT